ncbi:cytochrome P450 3A19-like [Oppia nitens]|uniref:cytochrome P450 3A19-like n=1 Tax=Oppia nitens TaxID=1686743 RepID=UPI0023DA1BAF|nr:cytochrome P450 3A19-like [Oppia nitens]
MTLSFTTSKLRKMIPSISNCLKNLDKKMVGFGTNVDSFDDSNPIVKNIKELLGYNPNLILVQFAPKLAKLLKLSHYKSRNILFMRDLIDRISQNRQQLLANGDETEPTDFLQILINSSQDLNNDKTNDKYLTSDEMIAQCIMYFVAGYETTTKTISMVIYNIANNPDVQQKLYEEAKQYFIENKVIEFDAIKKLKYLNAVISETLRLYPVVPFIDRTANRDYKLGGGNDSSSSNSDAIISGKPITVPKDTIVHIPIWSIHHDPTLFNDPEQFKPDRFLDVHHNPYAYLPFGHGQRNCPGMLYALLVIKIAVLQSVYKYKFHPSNDSLQIDFIALLMVVKEVMISFEKH